MTQCKELYYANQVSSKQPQTMQQTFILLRVHQYTLMEQLAICILYDMMYCIILIEYSSIVNILGVTGSF